ncbi:MAG: hypothetical protein HOW73_48535 [Polyangiaceae bacterium]|nr:hypothetical protein [Polyangiaceae bacterium]
MRSLARFREALRTVCFTLSAIVALFAAVPPASAQPSDPSFDEGRALMTAGDYAGACAKFKESWDKAPSAGRAFNLSACEEKQGHFVKAISWLDAGLGQVATEDPRATAATAKRLELLGAMPKLTVKLVSDAPADVHVTVNGTAVSIGVRTPVDPGANAIVVTAPKRAPATTTVVLEDKEVKTVEVSVGAPIVEPTPAPTPESTLGTRRSRQPQTKTELGGEERVIAGWIIGGVGAATTVAAVITGSIMLANDAAYHGCPQPSGDDRCASEEDARALGEALEIPNAVLWGTGLAALGTGVIMILVPRPEYTVDATAIVVPTAGPGFAGVSVHGAF